jgi:hypothetical protein
MTDFALPFPARTLPARARHEATRSSRPVQKGARPLARIAGTLGGPLGRALSRAARRPMRTLVQCAALGVAGLIIVNALALQSARHPAPLGASAAAPKGETLAKHPPLPPVRPSALAANQSQAAPLSGPVSGPAAAQREAAPARETVTARPAARAGDPIGDLLRGDAPRAETARGEASAREPVRPVLAAQRALVKLGHTQVKPDGVPGEATKSAIERFERERKLPVTGQLNPRTLRELAAASGMKLD